MRKSSTSLVSFEAVFGLPSPLFACPSLCLVRFDIEYAPRSSCIRNLLGVCVAIIFDDVLRGLSFSTISFRLFIFIQSDLRSQAHAWARLDSQAHRWLEDFARSVYGLAKVTSNHYLNTHSYSY